MKFLSALLLLTLIPLSAAAQEYTADRGPKYDARSGVGSFDLVLYVDGEALIYVQDTRVRGQVLSGNPVQNTGSNFTQPIPKAVFGDFVMDTIAGRGKVTFVEGPRALNNFTAVLRIKDDKPGQGLYHVRLSWTWNPADPSKLPYTGISDRGGSNNGNGRGRGNDSYDDHDHYGRGNSGDRDGVFEFKGRVDGVTVLHIHGDQVRVENLSGQPLRDQTFRFSGPMPTSNLKDVNLVESLGRGRVELVEKPWDGNRYTAVVRISDSSSGSGQYGFKLAWHR
jgi:hypothetical protein